MKADPIVEEVRKARQAHAAKFNYDLSAICADLKKKEKSSGHPVVSQHPKLRLKPSGRAATGELPGTCGEGDAGKGRVGNTQYRTL